MRRFQLVEMLRRFLLERKTRIEEGGGDSWQRPLSDPVAFVSPIIEVLREELCDDLVGVVLCGSYASGRASAHSDIDLQIVHKAPWKQRVWLTLEGVPLDIWIRPAGLTRATIVNDPDPGRAVASMFATGRILIDRDGIIAGLVEAAKATMRAPLPILPNELLYAMKHGAVSSLREAMALAPENPSQAAYLLPFCLHEILCFEARLKGLVLGKVAWHLPRLEQRNPALYRSAQAVLDTKRNLSARLAVLKSMYEVVLACPASSWDEPHWSERIFTETMYANAASAISGG